MRCPKCKTGRLRTASPLEVREGYHWCYQCGAEYQLPESHESALLAKVLAMLADGGFVDKATLDDIVDRAIEAVAVRPIPRPTGLEEFIEIDRR
jgi:hypothetical protein